MARFHLRYQNHTVLLAPGELVIGRGPDCGLPLDDTNVSRRHAILHVDARSVRIEDLGSRNGVVVNGERIEGTVELAHGDEVTIGRQVLHLVEEQERQRRAILSTISTADESARTRSELRDSVQRELGRDPSDDLEKLTPREQEVLRLVALGYAQKRIADELGISVKTVETFRTRINTKMGFESRVDLVRFAIACGLLDVGRKGDP